MLGKWVNRLLSGIGIIIVIPFIKHISLKVITSSSKFPPMQYQPPAAANYNTTGRPMNVKVTTMTLAGIPDENFSELNEDTVNDFVFVTGVSSNHFQEVLDAVGIVQRMMPKYRIYFYDLGLVEDQASQAKLFCGVTYVKFDFDAYPEHVKKLRTFAFKPLIVHEVLRSHRGLVWMDASFRLTKPMDSVLFNDIIKARGVMFFHRSPHSTYAVTDFKMYDYLPTDLEQQKKINQKGANSFFVHKTKELYWSVVYWWAMCAIDVNCMAPENSTTKSDFSSDKYNVYAGCHRYDQSAINILVSNMYGYDEKIYFTPHVVDIIKWPTHKYNVTDLQC